MMRMTLPPPPSPGYDIGQNFMSALAIGGAAIVCTFALLAFYFCRYVAIGNRSSRDEAAAQSSCCEARPSPGVALDKLPVVSSGDFAKLKGGYMVDECCAVCLTEFGAAEDGGGGSVRLLPKCGHCFHCECVDGWLQSHLLCPVCRTSVVVLALPLPASSSDEQNVLLEVPSSVQETGQQQQQHVVISVDEGQTPMLLQENVNK